MNTKTRFLLASKNTPWIILFQLAFIIASSFLLLRIYWLPSELPSPDAVRWVDQMFGEGDFGRFICQGWWLNQGRGFREANPNGLACTSLPPGYPVFLAFLFIFTSSLKTIRIIQCIIYVASGIIFFLSLRRTSPKLSFLGALVISSSPWSSALASIFMSEVFSTFLSVLLTITTAYLCNSQTVVLHSRVLSGIAGMLCSLLALTAPVLSPVCIGILLVLLLKTRKAAATAMILIAGAAFPMGIWQAHCISATGEPCITLLTKLPICATDWISTWARTEQESVQAYHTFVWANETPDFAWMPSYAFRSESEKQQLLSLAVAAAKERRDAGDGEKVNNLRVRCTEIAAEEKQSHPLWIRLILPISRTVTSITHQRPVNFLHLEDRQFLQRLKPTSIYDDIQQIGLRRALVRMSRGVLAIWAITIHFSIILVTVLAITKGLISRDWLVLGILLSLSATLFLYGAHNPEARRLLPALPILFLLPIIATIRNQRQLTQQGYQH